MMDLFRDIVPAQAMGIEVHSFEDGRIELTAPLDKNLNDKGTGFAGSIASMLSLAGWGVISAFLQTKSIEADVMVVTSEVEYRHAVQGDMISRAELSASDRNRILCELNECGRCRVELEAHVYDRDLSCARMTASYAVRLK